MTKKMLIDAHQPEETRVVLLNRNKIEEFDYENNSLIQLKGNVYLARVTRVEPSLQAAFVEYGGNRQGFLAFSEIHHDYYRIPVEDREALTAQTDSEDLQDPTSEPSEEISADVAAENSPEEIGGDDEHDSRSQLSESMMRRYKIQEVITRKQILLVQVVKEERGNKGAALTTYLSLAGRYCVLMPNSNRGGGVSRKITNVADRKRLKSVVNDLDIPNGMAVIVRTAGSKRTKTEIKRDYAYLSKLWNQIREKTLQSEAPTLIHEEGSLVKRAIRDMYTNDVDEVLIEGEDSYKVAKTHMKMLIPSHAKRVAKYDGSEHLFQKYGVEPQLDTIHQGEVTLKSGGYLVINQTEALVAIDVNSGKATRERNIEETALKTNLEAAEEVSRQLKLRDLSGLIVIDFIDMEENRNKSAIERKLKDSLRYDRARIQVGSISHFGLLEMSRQRLRPSLAESVSQTCPHCAGTGRIRSINSSALQILRAVEEEAGKHPVQDMTIYVHPEVALYILNQKRASLASLEAQFKVAVLIEADATLIPPDYKLGGNNRELASRENSVERNRQARNQTDKGSQKSEQLETHREYPEDDEEQPKRKRRGRRGGRRRKRRGNEDGVAITEQNNAEAVITEEPQAEQADTPLDNNENKPAAQSSEKKPQKRAKPKAMRANKASDIAESETDSAQLVAKADEPEQDKDHKKKAAKNKTKVKKKTSSDKSKKTKAKAKKTSTKAKTKAAKSKSTAFAHSTERPNNLANSADSEQEKGATSDNDRNAKSSVEMTVINIDDTPAAKTKKKGWWSR
ncbi:MAG: ribonuclease E/G [Rhodospirillaceae bacterium]|nr:ribonuclease E/G [Rhodospirillaceae bacterium]